MKKVSSEEIIKKVADKLVEINYNLPGKVREKIENAYREEKEKYSKKYLKIILENIDIAGKNRIPICQDTGLIIVFVEIGLDVKIEMGNFRTLDEIINKGIEEGSKKGYLRNSIILPLERKNTGKNTPGVIHYILKEGDIFKITIISKGFGAENVSKIEMLNPSSGKEGIENFIIETVKKAGSLPCPPIFIGVGIGGSFEKAAILSKYALTKICEYENSKWEKEIIEKINSLKIGPGGFGGNITVLDLKIETYPTHIAGLPVAVNICCWAHRVGSFEL
ncbi:MAG: fumarate hydratase [Candidatus Ratteibacteria bacterium]